MSSHVCAIVPADDKFNEMKAIYDLCTENNVAVPQEVWDFFGGDAPDPTGVIVYLDGNTDAVTEYNDDMQEGFEVNIEKLDPKYKIIRFVNSY